MFANKLIIFRNIPRLLIVNTIESDGELMNCICKGFVDTCSMGKKKYKLVY